MSLWRVGTRLVSSFEPERAHGLTLQTLKAGLYPRQRNDQYPRLRTTVAGLVFPNPLGLAAGFDKNAEVPNPCLSMGFGFTEVGAVTPKPQAGNDRPRVFRLRQDQAIINRYGFNNDGLDAIAKRLEARAAARGIVGVNLGANKENVAELEKATADFSLGAKTLSPLVDFVTVNVSSPNTAGLRDLQGPEALTALLTAVREAALEDVPVFVKIAPDLTDEDKADMVRVLMESPIQGVIISNTTLARPEGLGPHAEEKGGLSGKPLFARSTAVLKEIATALKGRLPIIGVGGVGGADDAYAKILAGASLVQLYTALVYKGPDLVTDTLAGLEERLSTDGYDNITDAVGAGL